MAVRNPHGQECPRALLVAEGLKTIETDGEPASCSCIVPFMALYLEGLP